MELIILEIILFIILIIIAAYLAAAEIAIASFGQNKIEEMKGKGDPMVSVFEKIQKSPDFFFGTIQIISTLSLMSSAILAYHLSTKLIYPFLINIQLSFISDSAIILTFIISVIVVSFFI